MSATLFKTPHENLRDLFSLEYFCPTQSDVLSKVGSIIDVVNII